MYKIIWKAFAGKEYSFDLEAREIEFEKAIKKYDKLKKCFEDVSIIQVIPKPQPKLMDTPLSDHHIKDMEEQVFLEWLAKIGQLKN